jgi:hypothetical protein
MRKLSLLCVLLSGLAAGTSRAQYSNAVQALSPIGYWPLNETQSPGCFIATNSGTLGAIANGHYNDPLFIGGNGYIHNTLYTGTVTGVTSDGDAAAGFDGGANGNLNDGYLVIPEINGDLNVGKAFTTELWVMPGGGDPNDPSGSSFASTEWTALIKQGGGGLFFTENGDANGNAYGYTIAMAGIYSLGYPDGWYGGVPYTSPVQLQTNAMWVVDFYGGNNGGNPSLEFDVPFQEPSPQWFHLVLTFDGTNANFYTNGVLAATTVPGSPQSTNSAFTPNNPPITTSTGAYAFTTVNGVKFAADTINPLIIGDIQENYSLKNYGYPQPNAIGYNCQIFNGSMDETAIYTNALSAATVAQHFADATAVNTTLYTNDVFTAKPIVYLRFDEPASNFVEPDDSTRPIAVNYGSMGAAANGLYEPDTTPATAGPVGAGLGSPSYGVQMNTIGVIDAGASALNMTGLDPQGVAQFSASLWFRANPADIINRFQTIAGRGDSAWRFSIDGSGHARWNPGKGPELANGINLNDGAWHQLVGTSDGTNDFLYVDGVLGASGTGVGSLGGTAFDLIIGGAPDYLLTSEASLTAGSTPRRIFDGQVSQVAFFGTTLTSNQVVALYSAAGVAPFIVQQPTPASIIAANASVSLSVGARGAATLVYHWYLGTNIVNNVAGNISGATTSTLTISNAVLANSGNYTVVVSNTSGSVTSSVATVTVTVAPSFVTQPAPTNASYYAGNKVAYTFNATGATPLGYQLYQNSAPVSGATPSNFTVTTLLGTNKYYVVVTNGINPPATSTVVTVVGQAAPSSLVVNFAVVPNSTGAAYAGQGAYSDPGNNVWNAFPQASGTSTALASNSAGGLTLVTASLIYGFNNGAGGATQGTPGYLESYEDAVNTGSPGIGNATTPEGQLTLADLPQGSYSLYLYGANYDGDRGSIFAASSGAALGGTNETQNGSVNGTGAVAGNRCTFALGDNYVIFTNVTTDVFGDITVTYVPDTNALSGNSGEAPFNGVQVIKTSITGPTLTINASGSTAVVSWTPPTGVLQASTNLPGNFTDIVGASSPFTTNLLSNQLYFRVRLP